jgi:hypothetical protein
VKSICIQYKLVPTNYNSLISSEDVQSNIKPQVLYERINKSVENVEDSVYSVEPKEVLKYKNHSGYNLPLTMDVTK